MEKEVVLLVNKAICKNCNEEIVSKHRHDFVKCSCGNSAVDGGTDYLRRMGGFIETSLYSDSPFEELRKYIYRGGRGKNGDQPLTWVALDKINDNWLLALIEYEEDSRPNNFWLPYYKKELEYRKENNITIKEDD